MAENKTQAGPSSTRAGWAGLVAICAIACLLISTVFVALPSNVLAVKDGSTARKLLVELMPQGWAFFTKPPSDSEVIPYTIDGTTLNNVLAPPQATAKNLLGLSRKQRAQGPEFASYVNQAQNWHDCKSKQNEECITEAINSGIKASQLKSEFPAKTICGSIAAVETVPVRWAFREFKDVTREAKRVALLEVKC